MRCTVLAALLLAASGIAAAAQRPAMDVLNVAALARLYGVVRYFYPADAAAALDWNRFAVYATKEVRRARSAKELGARLTSLFAPLGPGILIAAKLPPPPPAGTPDSTLVAWRYLGAAVTPTSSLQGPYRGKRTQRPLVVPGVLDGFAGQMQAVPAAALRGGTVRLRALVRAEPRDPAGSAALWLRVDRAGGQPGFFDNLADRPIRDRLWREYAITGVVAEDATNLVFGTGALGAVVADFDAVALESRVKGGEWTALAIADPGFEGGSFAGWSAAGNAKRAVVTHPSEGAPEGKRFLRIAPPPDTVTTTELFEDGTPSSGAHIDIDLGAGLRARVPLALTAAEASAIPAVPTGLTAALTAIPAATDASEMDARLADTVVAWNVFRHFYPYWKEAAVDWDARLIPLLDESRAAATREEHRNALRRLVAAVGDGHGSVNDMRDRTRLATLPIQLRVVEKSVIVTASDAPAEAPVGAVVVALDDVPARKRLADLMQLASGTEQWRQTRALNEMIACAAGARLSLSIDAGNGPRRTTLVCTGAGIATEKRPAAIGELRPGIWYVDLTRARAQEVTAELGRLSAARGVVFDVRGYPTDAGARILPHLMQTAERDRWMHVGKLIGPAGQTAGWLSLGWDVQPAVPRIAGQVVFLTDGRAISYAESVLGYVADRTLGTIVGAPTAGANGNVAAFMVPGGFTIAFTGMRVTRHDGVSQHHLVGIQPDIVLVPTIAAIRAGRYELLDRAIDLIERKQPAAAGGRPARRRATALPRLGRGPALSSADGGPGVAGPILSGRPVTSRRRMSRPPGGPQP